MQRDIGFMQGRLSPIVDGKIQAFPWSCWRDEFSVGATIGFGGMEWTIDDDRLAENPLVNAAGQCEIRSLIEATGLAVWSVTGDCFMQAPFWKSEGLELQRRLEAVRLVSHGCATVGGHWVVVPLVDNGSVRDEREEAALRDGLTSVVDVLKTEGVGIAFESDLPPEQLSAFIAKFTSSMFGVNLDIGNSASLGNAPEVEIPLLGSSIVNVHIKDRKFGGTTVPLGMGDADIPRSIALLQSEGYRGRYILQTARAADGDHARVLTHYFEYVRDLIAS